MWVSFRGPPAAVEAPRGLPPHRSVHTFGLWLWGPDGSRHVGPRAATTPARRGRGVRFDSAAASLLPCRLRLSSDGASERASGGYKSSPPLAHSRRPTQTSPLPPHRRLIRHRSFVRSCTHSLSLPPVACASAIWFWDRRRGHRRRRRRRQRQSEKSERSLFLGGGGGGSRWPGGGGNPFLGRCRRDRSGIGELFLGGERGQSSGDAQPDPTQLKPNQPTHPRAARVEEGGRRRRRWSRGWQGACRRRRPRGG
jgi:hypothetical protein